GDREGERRADLVALVAARDHGEHLAGWDLVVVDRLVRVHLEPGTPQGRRGGLEGLAHDPVRYLSHVRALGDRDDDGAAARDLAVRDGGRLDDLTDGLVGELFADPVTEAGLREHGDRAVLVEAHDLRDVGEGAWAVVHEPPSARSETGEDGEDHGG